MSQTPISELPGRVSQALWWPYYTLTAPGELMNGAVAFAAMYWWIGGMPFQGQDAMTMIQGYALGAGAFYVVGGASTMKK